MIDPGGREAGYLAFLLLVGGGWVLVGFFLCGVFFFNTTVTSRVRSSNISIYISKRQNYEHNGVF